MTDEAYLDTILQNLVHDSPRSMVFDNPEHIAALILNHPLGLPATVYEITTPTLPDNRKWRVSVVVPPPAPDDHCGADGCWCGPGDPPA